MSIWVQVMLSARPSKRVDFVSPRTACLEDVYGDEKGRGVYADIDPLFMMRPMRDRYMGLPRHSRGKRTYLLWETAI